MPPRPAAFTPSTVFGPIPGRSNRRSCSGFGALTSTPRPTQGMHAPAPAAARRSAPASRRCLRRPRPRARADWRPRPPARRRSGPIACKQRQPARDVVQAPPPAACAASYRLPASGFPARPRARRRHGSRNARRSGRHAREQMIVAAAESRDDRRQHQQACSKSSRIFQIGGRTSVPMKTISRQPSARISAINLPPLADRHPVMRIGGQRAPRRSHPVECKQHERRGRAP